MAAVTIAIGVLIALGMLGDLMIVAYGSAPLLIAGLVAMLRERRWQAGLAPVSARIASAGIGEGVLLVTEALGRFKPGSPLRLAALGGMPANLGHLFAYGADLAGLTNGGQATDKVPARWAVRTLASAGVAVSLILGAGVGYALSSPAPAQPAGVLATWLEAHDLRIGIGGYWSASITTVESSGAVSVRPVSVGADGFEGTMSQSTASWYAGQRFQFFVYGTTKFPNDCLALAIMTWGAPEHVYYVGRYRVLVWDHLLTVAVFPPA